MMAKEEAIMQAFASFENSLAYAAPEMYRVHIDNLRETVIAIVEDDDEEFDDGS